jgi:hypothetical protein
MMFILSCMKFCWLVKKLLGEAYTRISWYYKHTFRKKIRRNLVNAIVVVYYISVNTKKYILVVLKELIIQKLWARTHRWIHYNKIYVSILRLAHRSYYSLRLCIHLCVLARSFWMRIAYWLSDLFPIFQLEEDVLIVAWRDRKGKLEYAS